MRRGYAPRVTQQPRSFGPKNAPHCYNFQVLAGELGGGSGAELARRLRVHPRTIVRLRSVGLTESQADEYAGRAGLHPENVWPEWGAS